MKQEFKTPITDQYLKSLGEISPAEPKAFFYERLINRLENEQQAETWSFPLKPIWMICTLVFLLLLNTLILTQNNKTTARNSTASIEGFANAYDQQISSY